MYMYIVIKIKLLYMYKMRVKGQLSPNGGQAMAWLAWPVATALQEYIIYSCYWGLGTRSSLASHTLKTSHTLIKFHEPSLR